MKTETQARIIRLIRSREGLRPMELAQEIGISPQALHRHLKSLVSAGMLEPRGRAPKTKYFIAGEPSLEAMRRGFGAREAPLASAAQFICETRDVFSARLGRLDSLSRHGLAGGKLSLFISTIGEIGNNCFDHNLGHWRDVPGCWFETQITGKFLWALIADRGQGVFQSLKRVLPAIPDEAAALIAAFEKRVSGRAPENRGNGLKFVRKIIEESPARGLACRSGAGLIDYGALGPDCRGHLAGFSSQASGTITLLAWRLK